MTHEDDCMGLQRDLMLYICTGAREMMLGFWLNGGEIPVISLGSEEYSRNRTDPQVPEKKARCFLNRFFQSYSNYQVRTIIH